MRVHDVHEHIQLKKAVWSDTVTEAQNRTRAAITALEQCSSCWGGSGREHVSFYGETTGQGEGKFGGKRTQPRACLFQSAIHLV